MFYISCPNGPDTNLCITKVKDKMTKPRENPDMKQGINEFDIA